jgi:carbon monoxide dehydrogenase subunit G
MMATVGSRLIESAAQKYVNRIIDSLKQKLAQ